MNVKVIYLDNYNGGEDNAKLTYAKPGDSGFDLRAATNPGSAFGEWNIPVGKAVAIPTGIKAAVPVGFEMQIRTRSGTPLKSNFFVANSPGTIDSGYRGEIGVIVYNLSEEIVIVQAGDRIAQGVICPVFEAVFEEVDELDETERGEDKYNSTGVK